MSDVVIVHDEGGDWVGVYADARLYAEGHSLRPSEFLEAAGVEYKEIWDWQGEEHGHLPYYLGDVPAQTASKESI